MRRREGDLYKLAKAPFLNEKARRRLVQTLQGALSSTRRREGDLYKLAKAPYCFGQEGEKATCTNSPRRLIVSAKKARRRLVQTRQGALSNTGRREGDLYKFAKAPFFKTRRREGDLYKLTKAPCLIREGDLYKYHNITTEKKKKKISKNGTALPDYVYGVPKISPSNTH